MNLSQWLQVAARGGKGQKVEYLTEDSQLKEKLIRTDKCKAIEGGVRAENAKNMLEAFGDAGLSDMLQKNCLPIIKGDNKSTIEWTTDRSALLVTGRFFILAQGGGQDHLRFDHLYLPQDLFQVK